MIHELLQITGSHNVEGTLLIPKDTGSAQTVTGSVAHQNGEIFIFNGENWQTLGAQSGITQPDFSLRYIVVAGGGGGGGWGGGGGAGGMLTGSIATVTSGSSFTATIGGGGTAGAGGSYTAGGDGGASSLAGSGYTTVSTVGGGGGGYYNGYDGRDGGSGGGGGIAESGTNNVTDGGSGTAGQGNDGGRGGGRSGIYYGGGGGGGAGQVGQDHVGQTRGGHGGSGSLSNITGTDTFYAGGGGGHTDRSGNASVHALGGPGGGGDGGIYNNPNKSAVAGETGTGGGGGSATGTGVGYDSFSAAGGSGVVIVSYDSGSFNGGGGIVGPGSGSKKSHSFLTTGTFKIGATTDFQIVTDNMTLHLDAGDYASRGTSTWTDLTGNQNGTVSGPSLDGNFYYTFSDSSTDEITTGTIGNIGTDGTFEGWYYFNTSLTSNPRFWCTTNNTGGADAYIDTSTGRLYLHGGTGGTTAVFSLNAWVHVAVTYTSGAIAIYYNGVSQTLTGTTTGYNLTNTNNLHIGAFESNGYAWRGYIAQFRMYSDALSAAEVLQNYNATKTNFV